MRLFRTNVLRLAVLLVVLFTGLAPQADQPVGFQRVEMFSSAVREPIDILWLPNGKMMVAQKDGRILLVDPTTPPLFQSLYADLDAETFAEKGLESITIDPDFANSPYIYAFYHPTTSNKFRVVRWMHDIALDTALMNTLEVIWEDGEAATSCCHFGGGLSFGPDGCLYIGTGDEFDGGQSQSLTRHGGKILRINKDGTIPLDNPYADGPGGLLDEIWAIGLRNPFRIRWDMTDNRLYIGEVGGNDNAVSTEDLHIGAIGANYGWPFCEGDCAQPAYNDPIYFYGHASNGAAIVGGEIYRHTSFPFEYQNAYFYGDFVHKTLSYLKFDDNGDVEGSFVFDPALQHRPVSIRVGPDGHLYYCHHSTNGNVFRIEYQTADPGPQITAATADVQAGAAPLDVAFTGTAIDPDDLSGSLLTYSWDFGDGNSSTLQNPSHQYPNEGPYSARLFVSDASSTVFSPAIAIAVGTPPTVNITGPLPGAIFEAGDSLIYQATATEPGETFGVNDFEWFVTFLHNDHTHPASGPSNGPSGSFFVTQSGHDYHDDTGYEFSVTVTDSTGLSSTETVTVEPDKVDITFQSVPSGLTITLDGIERTTPFVYDTLVEFEHDLSVNEVLCDSGRTYSLLDWSDGDLNASRNFEVPATDSTITVNFLDNGPCDLSVTNGLVLHLDAGSGVTEANGLVTSWTDRSLQGNDATFVGGTTYVTDGLNGRPVLNMDGVDGEGVIVAPTGFPLGASDRTIYLVVRYNSNGYGGVVYGNTMPNEAFGLVVTNVGRAGIQSWGGDLLTTIPVNGAGWLVHSAVVESNSVDHELDGFPVDVDTKVFATTQGDMILGRELDGSPFINFDLAEVILYDRALGTREKQEVLSYLSDKYFSTPVPEIGTRWAGTANSSWSNASNWTNGVPTAADFVTIPSSALTQPVVLSGETVAALNLVIEGGSSVEIESGALLSVGGDLSVQGSLLGAGVLELNGNGSVTATAIGPDVLVNAAGAYTLGGVAIGGDLTIMAGTASLAGDVEVAGNTALQAGALTGTGTLDLEGDLDLQATTLVSTIGLEVAGDWTSPSGLDLTGNAVAFDGTAQDVSSTGTQFGDVAVNGTLDMLAGPFAVSGDLTGSGSFTLGDNVLLTGSATVAAGFSLPNTAVNTGATVALGDGASVNGSLGQVAGDVLVVGTLTVTGDYTHTAGELDVTTGMTIGGNATFATGTLTGVAGAVLITGNATFAGTTLSTPPSVTVSGNFTADVSFTPDANFVRLDGATPNLDAPDAIFQDLQLASATVNVVASPVQIAGALSLTTSSFSGGSILRFVGDGQTIPGANLPNVEVDSAGNAVTLAAGATFESLTLIDGTLTADGASTVSGNALFQGGVLTEVAGAMLSVAGDITFSGTTVATPPDLELNGSFTADAAFAPSAGLVRFAGPSVQTLNVGIWSFLDLDLENTIVDATGGAVGINGNLTLNAGSFTGTSTLRFTGAGQVLPAGTLPDIEIAGTGTAIAADGLAVDDLLLTSGTLELAGGMTVAGNALLNGGTLSTTSAANLLDVAGNVTFAGAAAAAPPTIRLAGNWNSDAAFAPSSGSVEFASTGGAQDATTTSSTFQDVSLVDTTLTTLGDALALAGDLSVDGSSVFSTGSTVRFVGAAQSTGSTALPNVVIDATGTVDFADGAQVLETLVVQGGTLRITGTTTVDGLSTFSAGTLASAAAGAKIVLAGDAAFSGTDVSTPPDLDVTAGWTSDASFDAQSGVVTVTMPTTFNATGSIFNDVTLNLTGEVAVAPSSLDVRGTVATPSGTFAPASVIRFVDTASAIALATLPNVVVAAVGTVTAVDGIAVDGDLTLTTGTLELAGGLTVAGNALMNGGTLSTTSAANLLDVAGNVTFAGTAATAPPTIRLAGNWNSDAAFAPSSGSVEFASTGGAQDATTTSSIFQDVSLVDTTLATLGDALALAGNLAMDATSAFDAGSTVRFVGDGQSTAASGLPNVVIDANGIVTLNDGATVLETLQVLGGTLEIGGTVTVDGTSTFSAGALASASAGAKIVLNGDATFSGTDASTPPNFDVLAGWTSDATFSAQSGLVTILSPLTINATDSVFNDVTLDLSGEVSIAPSSLDLRGIVATTNGAFAAASLVRFVDTANAIAPAALPNVEVDVLGTVTAADTVMIGGDLTLTGGTLELSGLMTVNGEALLNGGVLARDPLVGTGLISPFLDVAGDVTFAGAAATTPPDLRLGGAWSSDTNFAPTVGTVSLTSAASSLTPINGATSLSFEDLVLETGANLDLAGDLVLNAASVGVATGASVDVATHSLTVAGALIDVDGVLSVGTGGALNLASMAELSIFGGGTLELLGAFGVPARIVGDGSEIQLGVAGLLRALNFEINSPGSTGLVIDVAATFAAAPEDMRFGTFTGPSPVASSVLLDVDRASATELKNLTFTDPLGVGTFNATTGGPGAINMVNSDGPFAGDTFESDVLDLISWTTSITTLASFTATSGAVQVRLAWTTTDEVDTQTFQLESGPSVSGPWTEIFSTPALGGGSNYSFTDFAVAADVPVSYRLRETVLGGVKNSLGFTEALPWSDALPFNVVRVGLNGTESTIQGAVDNATGTKTMLLVEPGTYAPFTIDGNNLSGLIVIAGTGSVVIDTTTQPIVIQNVPLGLAVELTDLVVGTLGGSESPIQVSQCAGVVILDDLTVESMTADAAIDVAGALRMAVQRTTLIGSLGLNITGFSSLAISRTGLAPIVSGPTSTLRVCEVSSPITLDPLGSQLSYLGQMPNFDIPETVAIGTTTAMSISGETGRFWQITISPGIDWGVSPNPRFEMVALTNLGTVSFAQSGVFDGTGQADESISLPPDTTLVGSIFHMQVWAIEFAGPPILRLSNVVTVVLTP